jgi:hypothetical protein
MPRHSSTHLNENEHSHEHSHDHHDSAMCPSKHVINVVVPRDRLNDFRYIQLQLLDTKCNALDYISKKLNIPITNLIRKYIPEMNPLFHTELYTKYSIDTGDVNPDAELDEFDE